MPVNMRKNKRQAKSQGVSRCHLRTSDTFTFPVSASGLYRIKPRRVRKKLKQGQNIFPASIVSCILQTSCLRFGIANSVFWHLDLVRLSGPGRNLFSPACDPSHGKSTSPTQVYRTIECSHTYALPKCQKLSDRYIIRPIPANRSLMHVTFSDQ